MIGIDVIDRTYPDNFTRHSADRYRSRILNGSETDLGSGRDALLVLWAIKESVYKCYCNSGGAEFYNPKRIRIDHLDMSSFKFRAGINDLRFPGIFKIHSGTIISIASITDLQERNLRIYLSETADKGQESTALFGDHSNPEWQEGINKVSNLVTLGKDSYFYSRSHHGKWYASVALKAA